MSLLYIISDPQDPVAVWTKLGNQFEKKTWATRLDLRRKLHSLQSKDGESAQMHIKVMTEIFDLLAVAGETVSEEDRVVYLLASLPESYNVLVTALEANEDVPKLAHMQSLRKAIRNKNRQLKRLKLRLEMIVENDSVEVDEELSQDLQMIVEDPSNAASVKDEFKRIFWD